MLILRHPDGSKIASPEQMQIWMKQTMDWIGGIAAQNKYVGGQGLLFDDSRVVSQHRWSPTDHLARSRRRSGDI